MLGSRRSRPASRRIPTARAIWNPAWERICALPPIPAVSRSPRIRLAGRARREQEPVKDGYRPADLLFMPLPRDDVFVSPELALVDDELATRLRSVTAAPVRASLPLAERSFVWHVEPRRSSHARKRLVALAVPAIVAALAVVLHDVSTTDGPTTETARPLVSATTSDVGTKPSRPAPRHAATPKAEAPNRRRLLQRRRRRGRTRTARTRRRRLLRGRRSCSGREPPE